MCYADKLIVMPEHATLAPPICRLAGEFLSIGRRVTQKGVVKRLCKRGTSETRFCTEEGILSETFMDLVPVFFNGTNYNRKLLAPCLGSVSRFRSVRIK